MKIRVALIDDDAVYRKRLAEFYIKNYEDKIEILSYSSIESFEENKGNKMIDLMLVSESIDNNLSEYLNRISIAYLSDRSSLDFKNNIKVINKYKKPEMIYKEILNVLADSTKDDIAYRFGDGKNATVEVFMPVSGGAGATTLAVAYARKLARRGIPTLYLNFETINSTRLYLTGDIRPGFDEIIYALKSKKQNLSLKIESNVMKTAEGLSFFGEARSSLDMLEIKDEDIITLINEIQGMGVYKNIIVDTALCLNDRLRVFSKLAHRFVLIAEQSVTGMQKLMDFNKAILLLEDSKSIDITHKLSILCNKAKDGNTIQYTGVLPIKEYIHNYPLDSIEIVEKLVGKNFLESTQRGGFNV